MFLESNGLLEAEEEARILLSDAQNPTGIPNFHTRGKIEASHLFKESLCDCAPWFLNVKQDILDCGTRSCKMASGYIVYPNDQVTPETSISVLLGSSQRSERRNSRSIQAYLSVRNTVHDALVDF